jgi:enterochelin esterase-like enzyme
MLLDPVSVSAQDPDDIPVCPAQAVMCRVEQTWTQPQLEAEIGTLGSGEGDFIAHDDQLTLVYRPSKPYVSAVSTIIMSEVPMEHVDDSDWWILTIQFDGVDEALLTFGIIERSSSGDRFAYPFLTWRGQNALPEPAVNDPVQGSLDVIPFQSEALSAKRNVHLYLPPGYDSTQTYPVIYMLDGEILREYVGGIDYLITERCVPSLIIVGVESAPFQNAENLRGEEYVPGRNPERFTQHERFFTQEVREWAEASYGASSHRNERVIFGVSNGGLFAVEMTLRHPELYGIAFPFSAGASQDFEKPMIQLNKLQLPLQIYSTAGSLEPVFDQLTRDFAQAYTEAGAEVVFSERVAGHNDALWQVEFVNAVKWAFGDPQADCVTS